MCFGTTPFPIHFRFKSNYVYIITQRRAGECWHGYIVKLNNKNMFDIYIYIIISFQYFLYIFLELKFKITFIHVIIMRSQVSGVLSPQTFAIIIYNYERAFSVARTQTPVIKWKPAIITSPYVIAVVSLFTSCRLINYLVCRPWQKLEQGQTVDRYNAEQLLAML